MFYSEAFQKTICIRSQLWIWLLHIAQFTSWIYIPFFSISPFANSTAYNKHVGTHILYYISIQSNSPWQCQLSRKPTIVQSEYARRRVVTILSSFVFHGGHVTDGNRVRTLSVKMYPMVVFVWLKSKLKCFCSSLCERMCLFRKSLAIGES